VDSNFDSIGVEQAEGDIDATEDTSDERAKVDARGASGVQIGDGTTQFNYTFNRWADSDSAALPPVMGVCGDVQSPYRGLDAFDQRNAVFFFGREADTTRVLEHMSSQLQAGILVISGVSGAGKSSLLQAGVIPRLSGTGLTGVPEAASWPCVIFSPGAKPLDELSTAVAPLAGADSAEVRRGLSSDPGRFVLTARQAALRSGDGRHRRLVMIIDQFEQLFTQCRDEKERGAFLTAIAAATATSNERSAPALIILGIRADFEARCAEYPLLTGPIQNRYLVTSMTDRQLRMAITEPPKKLGARVDDDLLDTLLREVKSRRSAIGSESLSGATYGAGVLPLLSHALDQAWRNRLFAGSSLTLDDYERVGGIEKAIAGSADHAYAKLTPRQQSVARQIFIRLTTTSVDGVDTADRVNRDDLLHRAAGAADEDVDAVLEAFAGERLLTLGPRTVEISHEVLLSAWPLLRDTWLAETRADRAVRSRLDTAADEWIRHNEDPSYLYGGSRLDLATETVSRLDADSIRRPSVSQRDRDFLNASLRVRRRAVLRRRAFTASLMVLVLAIGSVAALAFRASQSASHQRDIAISRQLISESADLTVVDPATARLKSIAGWRIDPSGDARYAMLATASYAGIAALRAHAAEVLSVAFSRDGKLLASSGGDNSVRLWDVASHRQVGSPLTGHTSRVSSVAFSPDGKLLASSGVEDSVRLWDVASHRQVGVLSSSGTGGFLSVASSPDGKLLASGGVDGSVRLWDLASHRQVGSPLTRYTDGVLSVAFSPDGETVASGGVDGSVRLWDVASHRQVGSRLTGHSGRVSSVAFSADGDILASSGDDSVRLWDVARHRQVGELSTSHTGGVLWATFSPDGKTVASGGVDGSVRLWDVASHRQMGSRLTGHTGRVSSVAFSPDGKLLASSSWDNSVRLWDVSSHRRIGSALTGHSGAVSSVAFSPDGRTLASSSWDDSLRLWDVASQRPVGSPLTGHTGGISSVAFSPDGKLLASSGFNDNSVRLWDVATHRQIGSLLTGHTGAVLSVAFSPDGKLLASSSGDNSVRMWDVASHRQVGSPLGGHTDEVLSVAFSPDGKLLASGSGDNSVRLWNVARHRQVGSPLPGHTGGVSSVAFSPDGATLATGGGDDAVRLWNVARHRQVGSPLTGHTDGVLSVAFSPDGSSLASSSWDDSVRLWDVASQRQVGSPLTGHTNDVLSVAFSPDGKTLASGGLDNLVLLWNVPELADPASFICGSLGQATNRDQWRHLVPPGPSYRALCP
jgi:WD40 repeat protein